MSVSNPEVKRLKRVFGVVYFVQGMSGLPELSIFYYMMNILKLGPVAGQLFQGLNHVAWFMKPLWGLISDRLPIFGYRRKSYFVLMATLALFSWLAIGLCAYLNVNWVIPYFVLINLAQFSYAFVDVVVDALMVEHGQDLKQVGSFVNFQWLMLGFAAAIVAMTSGWFQQGIERGVYAYWVIFAGTGLFPLLTGVIGTRNLREERILKKKPTLGSGLKGFWRRLLSVPKGAGLLFASFKEFRKNQRHILLLVLFIIAWNFSPSISYAARSYWVKELGFTPALFGILGAVSSVTWIVSILFYHWFARRFPSVRWDQYLYGMIVLGVLSLAAGYYFYLPPDHPLSVTIPFSWDGLLSWSEQFKGTTWGGWIYSLVEGASKWNRYHWWALITDTTLGFASISAWLIPLTLAGEAASKANAGFIYALLMSVANATNAIENVVGGVLYKLFSASWMQWFLNAFEYSFFNVSGSHSQTVLILQIFVYISVFFTLIAIPFVYMVRKEFVRRGIEVHLV